MEENRDKIIKEKRSTKVTDNEFNIVWEDKPSGFVGTILTFLHLNFTKYQISNDELIITKGFINRHTDSIELYLLKDPDMSESIIQRIFNVGSITVKVDSRSSSSRAGSIIVIKDVKNCAMVRKLLRDYIEADVMERGITYFDKV